MLSPLQLCPPHSKLCPAHFDHALPTGVAPSPLELHPPHLRSPTFCTDPTEALWQGGWFNLYIFVLVFVWEMQRWVFYFCMNSEFFCQLHKFWNDLHDFFINLHRICVNVYENLRDKISLNSYFLGSFQPEIFRERGVASGDSLVKKSQLNLINFCYCTSSLYLW